MKRRITDKIDFFKKNITDTHSWLMILAMGVLYASGIFLLKDYMTATVYYGLIGLSLSSISLKVMLKNLSYDFPTLYYWLSIIFDGLLFIFMLFLVGTGTQVGMTIYMIGFVMVSINILTLNCVMIAISGAFWVFGYSVLYLFVNGNSVDGIFFVTIIVSIVYTSVLTYISKIFQKMRLKALS